MTLFQISTMADFDHPFDMLRACHERIRAQLDTLARLVNHVTVHGCDDAAQQAAGNILRYFCTAGRYHHEDEENDLFPCLIAAAKGQDAERAALLVAELTAGHRELERLWEKPREVLERLARSEMALLDPAAVEHLIAAYRSHIEFEETNLLPLAEKLLGEDAVAGLGRSMARRRGVGRP